MLNYTYKKKEIPEKVTPFNFLWYHQESNRGHKANL